MVKCAYIGVQLPDKTWEVIVLKESRQQIPGKIRRIPHSETSVTGTPGNNGISGRIIHHLISLCQERRQGTRTSLSFIHQSNPNPPQSQISILPNSKPQNQLTPSQIFKTSQSSIPSWITRPSQKKQTKKKNFFFSQIWARQNPKKPNYSLINISQ